MDAAAVEVRKTPQSTTWYNARVQDVLDEKILVSFEDDIWPSREVPWDNVRRCPQDVTDDSFDPQADETVEVFVSASELNPSAWSLGRITDTKHSFYYVSLASASSRGATATQIVEKSALRPQSAEEPLDRDAFVRRLLPVEEGLHAWVRSEDSLGCLADVQVKTGLLVASRTNVSDESEGPPQVLLIGEEGGVDLGEKLLTMIHFRHQSQMQRFHDRREKLLERLEEYQKTRPKQHWEVFTVDSSLAGRIIGKKGDNIKQLREKHGVEIYIQDIEDKRGNQLTQVTVSGESQEAVQQARKEMDFVTVTIQIEQDEVGWILGKSQVWMREVAKMSALQYARFDEETRCLELCGLQHQVDDAVMLISVHREYFPVKKDMDSESDQITKSFEQLESSTSRKGKGKEKDKGKEKGANHAGKGGGASETADQEQGEGTEGKQAAPEPGGAARGRGGGRGAAPGGASGRKGSGRGRGAIGNAK